MPGIWSPELKFSQRTRVEKAKISNGSIFGGFGEKSRSITMRAIFTKSGAF